MLNETEYKRAELLTDAEFEVLKLLGNGKSCVEIADALQCKLKTVEAHVANSRNRLGLGNIHKLREFATLYNATAKAQGLVRSPLPETPQPKAIIAPLKKVGNVRVAKPVAKEAKAAKVPTGGSQNRDAMLSDLASKHPDWGRAKLAKESGIPPASVQRWLKKRPATAKT